MFEWLSLKDIYSVGETCKRLNAIAGDFFKDRLSGTLIKCTRRGIESIIPSRTSLHGFHPYVKYAFVCDNDVETFQHIASIEAGQLKEICFYRLTIQNMKQIEKVLRNIETIRLVSCSVQGDLYTSLLHFCKNLKCLKIKSNNAEHFIGSSNHWLAAEYPKLESIRLSTAFQSTLAAPEIGTFFKLNPQIKILAIDLIGLCYHKDSLLQSNIKLDILVIKIDYIASKRKDEAFAVIYQLHDRGIYNRLHIWFASESPDKRVFAFPAIEAMELTHAALFRLFVSISSISLRFLKELNIRTEFVINESLARKIPNLERIQLVHGDGEQLDICVVSFLQHCARLNKIDLRCNIYEDVGLKLSKWNKRREKLVGARKVTIVVNEDTFLTAKWSNETIDLKFIEVQRADQSCRTV